MHKVFISHTGSDTDLARRIALALKKRQITVWFDEWSLKPGDNLIERIKEGLHSATALLVLVSNEFRNSKWAQHELSTWLLSEAGQDRKFVLPVRIRGASMPFDLQTRVWIDLQDNSQRSINRLVEQVAARLEGEVAAELKPAPSAEPSANQHMPALRHEYARGNLALFCGAGVSVEAGIPGWNVLLRRLLTRLFQGESSVQLAEAYQDRFAGSPLIVSQYLKNALGQDYRTELRRALYADNPKSSDAIGAIRDCH